MHIDTPQVAGLLAISAIVVLAILFVGFANVRVSASVG